MKKGLEIIAVCKDHSKTNTPEVEEHITIPFDFMLDKIVSQFTDSNFEPIDYRIADTKAIPIEPPVKPACERCKHRHTEEATNGEDLHLCQNPKIRLWNLTNCDIDITEFGCTYFESKSV